MDFLKLVKNHLPTEVMRTGDTRAIYRSFRFEQEFELAECTGREQKIADLIGELSVFHDTLERQSRRNPEDAGPSMG